MANNYHKPKPAGTHGRKLPVRGGANIFIVIFEIIVLLYRRFKRKVRRAYRKRVKSGSAYFGSYVTVVSAASVIAGVIVCACLVWGFTNKNAFEVYLGESVVGVIKLNKNGSPEAMAAAAQTMTATVVSKISNNLQVKIKPLESVTLKKIHASAKKTETQESVLSKLSETFKYQIEATSVILGGIEMALLKSDADFELVKESLFAPYRRDGRTVIREDFVEGLTSSKKYADISQTVSVAAAVAELSAKSVVEIKHTVKSGEVMGSIAKEYAKTVEDICKQNDIPIEKAGSLYVGQELVIKAERPVLSIETVEELVYDEDIGYKTSQRTNPSASGPPKVVRKGKTGKAQVTDLITLVNGIVTKTERVESKTVILVPPEDEIIEAGP